MTKEEQFVNELIGYIFAYPDDDYMTMECLCRKLVKHGLLDKVDGYYQTHEIRTNTHECVKDTHDKTESSSEIPNNYCDDCLYTDTCDSKEFFYACTSKATRIAKDEQTQLTAKCLNCNNAKACKEKHWEGCVYEPKDEKTCETCRHWKYIAKEWQCEAYKCQGYEPKDEPTISKMEQVEGEPQTEPLHTCSVNGRPYSECSSCEHFKCTADEPQTDCAWR